jgi:Outer membrane lipoprotein-sorting protein
MNTMLRPLHHALLRAAFLCVIIPCSYASAQDAAPSAKELAARLSSNIVDGASFVKLRMEIRQPAAGTKTAMNLYLKARRTPSATDIIYQVIFPKERKGEAFLVQKASGRTSGMLFVPPAAPVAMSAAQMKEGIFGSDISYEDLLENFFAWDNQAIVGTEAVGRTPCQILESKPGKGDRSGYAKVRSWIDVKKMVPMRVEKYLASGQVAKRIDTTDVKEDDLNRPVTRTLVVQRAGRDSVTEVEGTEIKHDVIYTDADFTAEGMQKLSPARSK